jgi:hypothetical protein
MTLAEKVWRLEMKKKTFAECPEKTIGKMVTLPSVRRKY